MAIRGEHLVIDWTAEGRRRQVFCAVLARSRYW
jgi:hypothetical protein